MFLNHLHTIGGVNNARWQQPLETMTVVELCQLEGQAEDKRQYSTNWAIGCLLLAIACVPFAGITIVTETGTARIAYLVLTAATFLAAICFCLLLMVEIVAFNSAKLVHISRINTQALSA